MVEHRWAFLSNDEREWARCRDCGEERYKNIGERLTNESLLGECPAQADAKESG